MQHVGFQPYFHFYVIQFNNLQSCISPGMGENNDIRLLFLLLSQWKYEKYYKVQEENY